MNFHRLLYFQIFVLLFIRCAPVPIIEPAWVKETEDEIRKIMNTEEKSILSPGSVVNYEACAESGNDSCQYILGRWHHLKAIRKTESINYQKSKHTIESNTICESAIRWYKSSAERQNKNSIYRLSQLYRWYECEEVNDSLGEELLEKSSELGSIYALLELSMRYEIGIKFEIDHGKAHGYLAKAKQILAVEKNVNKQGSHVNFNRIDSIISIEKKREDSIQREREALVSIGKIKSKYRVDYNSKYSPKFKTGWYKSVISPPWPLFAVTWTGAKVVAVGCIEGLGGIILTSPDGILWKRSPSMTKYGLMSVTWGDTQLAAVSYGGTIHTSPDGEIWTEQASDRKKPTLHSVLWNGIQFIAVGDEGTILTSPDGIAWTRIKSGTENGLKSVVWTGKQIVVVGNNGTILTSADGLTWAKRKLKTPVSMVSATWTGTQLVAIGTRADVIFTSPDGITWTERKSGISGLFTLSSITWTGSKMVAVGYHIIISSLDGMNWDTESEGNQDFLKSVLWTGSQLVAVGISGNGGITLTSP